MSTPADKLAAISGILDTCVTAKADIADIATAKGALTPHNASWATIKQKLNSIEGADYTEFESLAAAIKGVIV